MLTTTYFFVVVVTIIFILTTGGAKISFRNILRNLISVVVFSGAAQFCPLGGKATFYFCSGYNDHIDSDDNAPEDEEYTDVQDDTDYSIYYHLECFAKTKSMSWCQKICGI